MRTAQTTSASWPAASFRRRTFRNCSSTASTRCSCRERRSPRSWITSCASRPMPERASGATPGALMMQAARRHGERIALRYGERMWTFQAFAASADRLASGLARRLAPGDRVALFMAHRAEYLLLQCAIERAGLVRVPVNARSTAHEVGVILADCTPAALFCDATSAERARAAAKATHPMWTSQVDGTGAHGGPDYAALAAEAIDA